MIKAGSDWSGFRDRWHNRTFTRCGGVRGGGVRRSWKWYGGGRGRAQDVPSVGKGWGQMR